MSIMTQPPEWLAEGSEPPANKKQIGWEVDERPPAGWLNWLFNRIYQSLVELSSAITSHRSNTGNPHNVTPEQIGAETPTGAAAKANAAYSAAVDYANGLAAGLGDGLSQHVNATSVHGATSSATANRLIIRDSSGRAKVAAPVDSTDIARKAEVDSVASSLSSHTNASAPHGGHATTAALNSHVNNTNNPHGVTKSQVGLGNVENYAIATQAEAEAGTVNNKYMTPLRTAQAIAKMTPAIAIMTGTVYHGEIIPPPSGYTPEQCTWFVSPTTSAFNQYFGGFRCHADANRTVVAQWFDAGVSEWKPISANYIIIGVK